MSTQDVVAALRGGGGVVARREHPELAESMAWLVRRGQLRTLLPGVYCASEDRDDPGIRVRAAALKYPGAIFTGRTAASLSFWPEQRLNEVSFAGVRCRARLDGFTIERRVIPPEVIDQWQGIRFTSPALTVLDLCLDPKLGADAIDDALRGRRVTLASLYEALAITEHRSGNVKRRRLLLDSRDEPWSAAERLAHRVLRAAGITGWRTNWAVRVGGSRYFIDIAFTAVKLAIEIDGRLHETDQNLFESDRIRQNALVHGGWRVLRFTYAMLTERPAEMVAGIRAELAKPGY